MARPNKGLGHVEDLEGDPDLKWQLRLILSTLLGELTVDEACNELGIGATYFGMLRTRALQGALGALAPKPVGRPKKAAEPPALEALQRIAALEHESKILRAQLELEVLKHAGPDPPKRRVHRRAPRQEPPPG